MPDISRLVIEIDSHGIVKATGDLSAFEVMSNKVGKSTDSMAKNFGAFQLVINKLPGPLKSISAGLMGIVSPSQAVVSAFLEIGAVSKDCIAKYQEQEVHIARIGAVLESTGAQSWTTSEDLKNMADTLRRETGRSTNEIMEMQSVLLGFTGITGENFERLAGNMINMADVMGGSLTSSANTFGRALENPSNSLNALTRQGFVFTEEQKRMVRQLEEAGRLQEAQVIYLEAMENAFGDAATATREARGEVLNYAMAVDDLKLAFGRLASESGFTQFIQGNIARGINWYAGIISGIADMSNNIRLNNAAIAAFEAGIATNEQSLIALHFKIEEATTKYGKLVEITKRTSELNRETDRTMLDLIQLKNQYNDIVDTLQREKKEREEVNRLLGIEKQLSSEMAKIENEYDNTEEGKSTKVDREIAKWIKLRDSMWETATGSFQPLSEEHQRQIDVIIAQLQKGRDKLKIDYDDWVKTLSQATGYSDKDIGGIFNEKSKKVEGGLGGLGTIEKYTTEVNNLVDYMNNMPTLYEALGLEETEVLEVAADKMRSVLAAMVESGLWDGSEASFKLLTQKLKEADNKSENKRDEKYLAALTEQLADAGKSTYDLAVKRLMIEQRISEEAAKQALETQKNIDYINNGYDIIGEILTTIDDAIRSIRSGDGGYGRYMGGKFAEAGMNAIQGSDAGNFAQGTAQSGWIMGLINMLVGAISKVMNSIEGADDILNPVTNMLMETKDVLKSMFLPALIISRAFTEIGKILNEIIDVTTFGLVKQMAEEYDLLTATNDERQREEERLRTLNEQYVRLFNALKEQEEYYLQQRRHLNAEGTIESYQARSVNDMILSPSGVFRTDPEDYIIATKHPETLMSGNAAPVYITIENHGAKVSAQESTDTDGARQIKIIVDGIIQQGMAGGSYDGAFDAMSARRSGKRITA